MVSTFLECSQISLWSVLSQCNTRLRFLHLLYDIYVYLQEYQISKIVENHWVQEGYLVVPQIPVWYQKTSHFYQITGSISIVKC